MAFDGSSDEDTFVDKVRTNAKKKTENFELFFVPVEEYDENQSQIRDHRST